MYRSNIGDEVRYLQRPDSSFKLGSKGPRAEFTHKRSGHIHPHCSQFANGLKYLERALFRNHVREEQEVAGHPKRALVPLSIRVFRSVGIRNSVREVIDLFG